MKHIIKKSKTFDFQKFKTVRSFGGETYSNFVTLNGAFEKENEPKKWYW